MREINIDWRTSANAFQDLGAKLISNEAVSLIELLKNSYDAKATEVLVKFKGPLKKDQGEIIVKDNGHGMDLKTITDAWLVLATTYRQIQREKKKDDDILGEKGIGRISSALIAKKLKLVTRPANSNEEIEVEIDWDKFNDLTKMVTDFNEKIIIDTPKIFKKGSGTLLNLLSLRNDWNRWKVKRVATNLSRLINPVKPIQDFKIELDFSESSFPEFSGLLKPPITLENPVYKMEGSVNDKGLVSYEFDSIKQRRNMEGEKRVEKKKLKSNKTIPLQFKLRVWDLDFFTVRTLSDMLDVSQNIIKKDVSFAAGISLYRDNFRVLPYGEPDNDWLRLDQRRLRKIALYLSNSQIIGTFFFKKNEVPGLKDQSNRQGLIENEYYECLKETALNIINILENKRILLRRKRPVREIGMRKPINTEPLQNVIKRKENSSKKWVQLQLIEEIDNKITSQDKFSLDQNVKITSFIHKIESMIEKGRSIGDRKILDELKSIKKIQQENFEKLKQQRDKSKIVELKSVIEENLELEKTELKLEEELLKNIDRDKREKEQDLIQYREDISIYLRLSTLGLMVDKLLHDGNPILAHLNFYAEKIQKFIKKLKLSNLDIYNWIEEINSDILILQTLFDRLGPLGGKKSREIEILDLKERFQQIFQFWQRELDDLNIKVELPSETARIKMVSSDLILIFTNLITNSIYWLKQLDDKRVKLIKVSLYRDKNIIIIIFSDNGNGIDLEDEEDIFLPYFSRKKDGIGLGLTIVRETLGRYKGTIIVTDGPLKGANFKMKLKGI